jgi:hypothetical protein
MSQADWTREFPCTPPQVGQWLARMVKTPLRNGASGTVVPLPGGAVVVECQKRPPRFVGMDALPVTQVNLYFKGVAAGERSAFVAQFEDVARKSLG